MAIKKLLLNTIVIAIAIAAVCYAVILMEDIKKNSIRQSPVAEDSISVPDKYSPEEDSNIEYTNNLYGFVFALSAGWKGYTVIEAEWEGYAIPDSSSHSQELVEKGPKLLIRHPLWSEANQRQDIPIMIFDLAQWQEIQEDKFHIGAAPINPSELGRNNKYVFALPARYNYAFPEGYEEVEQILEKNPLQPFDLK